MPKKKVTKKSSSSGFDFFEKVFGTSGGAAKAGKAVKSRKAKMDEAIRKSGG
tara:strand:- start:279 stop:434 length:156 start_codon:yes stop_codon:yes gene_type:complete